MNLFPKAKDIFHTVLQLSSLFLEPVCRRHHGLNVNRHNTQSELAQVRVERYKRKPHEDKEVLMSTAYPE